ncbi:hypothetical protein [Tessaracoccus coleopterorum]|nr:hypothetical protein [Tessaracoccus coleopterorum]
MGGLGRSIAGHRVDVRGVKMFDVITSDDGSETWFEFFRDDSCP